jgi:hypothetical protein
VVDAHVPGAAFQFVTFTNLWKLTVVRSIVTAVTKLCDAENALLALLVASNACACQKNVPAGRSVAGVNDVCPAPSGTVCDTRMGVNPALAEISKR